MRQLINFMIMKSPAKPEVRLELIFMRKTLLGQYLNALIHCHIHSLKNRAFFVLLEIFINENFVLYGKIKPLTVKIGGAGLDGYGDSTR